MLTRAEYMADSPRLHQAYYLEVANAAKVSLPKHLLDASRKSTDPHFNDVPLVLWDKAVSQLPGAVSTELKARGDWLSLGTGVCVLKALARSIVRPDSQE